MRLRKALGQLRPDLLSYAMSLTLKSAAAEDLAHDAVLRALRSPATPRKIDDLRPWMFRVIRNLFIDSMRKERVRREFSRAHARLSDVGAFPPEHGDPVETLLVRQAFARLGARDREILGLVDILGLSYAQAATVLGVPAGTVMSRLSRARRAMIAAMGDSNVRPMARRKEGRGP